MVNGLWKYRLNGLSKHRLNNGCPYTGNIFTFKNQWYSAQDFYIKNKIKYSVPKSSVAKICVLSPLKGYFPSAISHSFYWFFVSSLFPRTNTSGPIGRAGRPWAALSGHGWRLGDRCARCRALALLPSGCCGVCRYRAPAVTAVAGRRARAASAVKWVGAGKQAGAQLPRFIFLRAPGLARWIRAVTSCSPALPPRRLRPGPPSVSWRRPGRRLM